MPGSPKPIIGDPNISEFILLASHGLRSPLTAIRWGLEVLANGQLGPHTQSQQALTVELHRNAREMSSILKSMITLSRLEQGVFVPDTQEIDIAVYLTEIMRLHSEWAEIRNITTTTSIPDHLVVTSDHSFIQSILMHLHSLAIESSDEGGAVHIVATQKKDNVSIQFRGKFLVPNLNFLQPAAREVEDKTIIGGTPGLLLFLAEKLAEAIGWTLHMDETEDDYTTSYTLHS